MAQSPTFDPNRAIAVACSEGLDAGLALLDTLNLDASLGECDLLHATRADLLRRAGRPTDALPHYWRALELAPSDPERRFLLCYAAASQTRPCGPHATSDSLINLEKSADGTCLHDGQGVRTIVVVSARSGHQLESGYLGAIAARSLKRATPEPHCVPLLKDSGPAQSV